MGCQNSDGGDIKGFVYAESVGRYLDDARHATRQVYPYADGVQPIQSMPSSNQVIFAVGHEEMSGSNRLVGLELAERAYGAKFAIQQGSKGKRHQCCGSLLSLEGPA